LRALTEQTYIDEVEYEEEGMAEVLMDENAIADIASQYSSCTKVIEITLLSLQDQELH